MKKIILFSLILLAILSAALISFSIYLGFKVIKPATQAINKNIEKDLSRVVRIPEGIPRPIYGFDETIYYWEMETLAKETVAVRYKFTPAFSSKNDRIIAILEMPENSDPSIFNKVLPAIIVDSQSLFAAQDPAKANLGANDQSLFSSIKLALNANGQTTQIIWEFEKKNLSPKLKNLYGDLDKYPDSVLQFLFGVPGLVIGLLNG